MKNLDFKIAQLIIQRIDGDRVDDKDYRDSIVDITLRGCGGFIVFGGDRERLKMFIDYLQSISGYELFIASDIETGLARQIKKTTRLPCQMALASALYPDNEDLLFEGLSVVSQECLYMGINMPLIPVLDVNLNPKNPIISTRAFSDNHDVVSWFTERYIKIFSKYGLLLTGKHFPGHGDTDVDSHIEMPIIKKSLKDIMQNDIKPFITAIDLKIPCIMVGHLLVPSIDEVYPSSLSYKTIHNLLQDSLGFKGLVMTDAMNMSALSYFGDIYTKSLLAGNHIILHPHNFYDCVHALKKAYEDGILPIDTIDKAFEKVREFKSRLLKNHINQIDWDVHLKVSEMIYKKSITLIKETGNIIPLKNLSNIRLKLFGDYSKYDTISLKHMFVLSDDYNEGNTDILLCAIFTTVSAWHGSSVIEEEEIRLIKSFLNKARKSIIVSFGSPYVLRNFYDEADVLIACYEPSVEAQSSMIRCLIGEHPFNYNLPVRI